MRKMKKMVCTIMACAVACSMAVAAMTSCTIKISKNSGNNVSSTSSNANNGSLYNNDEPHKFSKEDAGVNGVTLGMSMDEVSAILGEPNETDEDEYSSTSIIQWTYGENRSHDYSLEFKKTEDLDEYILYGIYVYYENVSLNNGLHVGSSKDDVIAAFTDDGQNLPYYDYHDEVCGTYLYGGFNEYEIAEQDEADTYQFAYIDESLDYSTCIQYYYCEVTEHGKYFDYGNMYRMFFYIDKETDKVENISISCSYDYMM